MNRQRTFGSQRYQRLGPNTSNTSTIVTIVVVVVSVAMLIAGAVMLGVGISNNNKRQARIEELNYPRSGKLKLEWSDEFNGQNFDLSKWYIQEITGAATGNNERQVYVTDEKNIFVSDGSLHIKATEIPSIAIPAGGSVEYIAESGKVFSAREFFYGYTEVRARIPVRNYIWPAIWFFSVNTAVNKLQPALPPSFYKNWPRTGEIDLIEVFGTFDTTIKTPDPSPVWTNTFGGGPDFWFNTLGFDNQLRKFNGLTTENAYVDYHTYGLEWTPDHLRFWLDATVVNGEITGGTIAHEIPRERWVSWNAMGDSSTDGRPFDQPMNLQMNVAVLPPEGNGVTGAFPQSPPNNQPDFNGAQMDVDYVRYYKFDGEDNYITIPRPISSPDQPDLTSQFPTVAKRSIPTRAMRSNHMSSYDFIQVAKAKSMNMLSEKSFSSQEARMEEYHKLVTELTQIYDSSVGQAKRAYRKSSHNVFPRDTTRPLKTVWEEEFNGNNLNLDVWDRRSVSPATLDFLGAATSTTDLANSYVKQGKLTIQPKKQSVVHPFIAPTTTIAIGSANVTLPQTEIHVVSTEGFNDSGELLVTTTNGVEAMNYNGKTATSFTNIDTNIAATGTMILGNTVTVAEYQRFFPFEFARSIAEITTAQIETLNPIVGYGYFEIRAKIPVVDSAATRIELVRLTRDMNQTTLVFGQIMVTAQEGLTNPTSSLMGTQSGGPLDTESRSLVTNYFTSPVPDRGNWHTYGVEIRPGLIRWYLDATVENNAIVGGTLLGEQTDEDYFTINTDNSASTIPNTPFDKKLFPRITVVPGGLGVGFTGENSYSALAFPASSSYPFASLPASKLEIDYVRFHEY